MTENWPPLSNRTPLPDPAKLLLFYYLALSSSPADRMKNAEPIPAIARTWGCRGQRIASCLASGPHNQPQHNRNQRRGDEESAESETPTEPRHAHNCRSQHYKEPIRHTDPGT